MVIPGAAILSSMPTERPRMIFDCPDEFRRAIRIRAGLTDQSTSEVVLEALRAFLTRELAMAQEGIQTPSKPRPKKPKA